ncbi:MAG: hypothetical protein MJZ81_09290 [Bacteroidales bacterium]|nr:hypothetical protein [Bacteroidales bacterium]
MSVIMAEDNTIQTIAAYIAKILNSLHKSGTLSGIRSISVDADFEKAFSDCKDHLGDYDANSIFLALRKLNANAYCSRYGEEVEDPVDQFVPYEDYREETRHEWMVRLYNIVRFFVYQCDESANDYNPLVKALYSLKDGLANSIAHDATVAMNLQWGRF